MAVAYPTTTDILFEQQRRLRQLELRQAREGRATPPEVTNEIADLRAQLADTAGIPASETERYTTLFTLLSETRADVRETRADVRQLYFILPIAMLALCGLLILLVRL